MRKSILVALATLVVAFVMGATPAFAGHGDTPSDQCATGDGSPVLATDGSSFVSVCVPGIGATTAAITGEDSGYIVSDADDNNPLEDVSQCLDGHIGVQVVDGTPAVAADDGEDEDGDHSYEFPQDTSGDPDPTVCDDPSEA